MQKGSLEILSHHSTLSRTKINQIFSSNSLLKKKGKFHLSSIILIQQFDTDEKIDSFRSIRTEESPFGTDLDH